MLNPQIVQFIQQNLRQGYDISSIKQHLLQYGYSFNDVEEAAQAATGQSSAPQRIEHHIALSPMTLAVLVMIIAGLGTGGFVVYKIASSTDLPPSQLLDLNLRPDSVSVAPGGSLFFMRSLSNYGSDSRYDIELTYTVTEDASGQVVATEHETVGLETLQTEKREIKLPPALLAGKYYISAVAKYSGRKAEAGFAFNIRVSDAAASCTDGVKNQNEAGVDCGGSCVACATCFDGVMNQAETGVDCGGQCSACSVPVTPPATTCNDQNACTRDVYKVDRCVYEPIANCCGNGVCDSGESSTSCAQDCISGGTAAGLTPAEATRQASAIASTDPTKAGQLCQSIEDEANRNRCFREITERSGRSSFCTKISSVPQRDNCYMTLVLTNKDYSVCDKIESSQMRTGCEQIKQYGQ